MKGHTRKMPAPWGWHLTAAAGFHVLLFAAMWWIYKVNSRPQLNETLVYSHDLRTADVRWLSPHSQQLGANMPRTDPKPEPESKPPQPKKEEAPVQITDPGLIVALPDVSQPSPPPDAETLTLEKRLEAYAAALLQLLMEKWHKPDLPEPPSPVAVEIQIGRDGRILRSRLVQPSNHVQMDQSVSRALHGLIRAKPLPKGFPEEVYEAVLTVSLP